MADDRKKTGVDQTAEARRRQRRKNLALALALGAFAALVYFVAIVRMSGEG